MTTSAEAFIRVASEAEVRAAGRLVVQADGHVLVLFAVGERIYAAVGEFALRRDSPEASRILLAAVRYLAAHTPTTRAQHQTYQIAYGLHRGERLYAEPPGPSAALGP
ncbi:MAG: hypothetical protein QN152_02415 [Armatimonadota bacterium]|nr:hypothetical protein [Armatimonadota bacterium]MDR7427742.1 hypothetical protein [Armatimonadota bacterium]MDR7464621.1 hypothetical protein [Armatimonadota bacterium]MDR7469654.1 hypothetical protein [Armatimonadota bacterium]MDR7474916.1 hypothetical protein [Armatimonadota bacterium]